MGSRIRHAGVLVRQVESRTQQFRYRTPIKFGGVALDRATILNVTAVVEDSQGRTAVGCGSMPLGNVWSFPSRVMSYDDTLGAMLSLADQIAHTVTAHRQRGHPVDLFHALEAEFFADATKVNQARKLPEPIPKLCTLVCGSAFDAAIHDAYGKLLGLNCYQTYGPELVGHDLGHYLGHQFCGDRIDTHLREQPAPTMPVYHLVGALDPLTPADVQQPVGDGYPETLAEWIRRDRLTHLKIKLNGDDATWDRDRIIAVDAVATKVQAGLECIEWWYSLDFNERCPSEAYLLDILDSVRLHAPQAFTRIQYIEQPTARDLRTLRHFSLHAAAKLKPLVIDESLTDLETMLLARDLGYSGAALKACKGQPIHSFSARPLGNSACSCVFKI